MSLSGRKLVNKIIDISGCFEESYFSVEIPSILVDRLIFYNSIICSVIGNEYFLLSYPNLSPIETAGKSIA